MVYKNRKIVYNINHVESIINTKKREGMILIMENNNVEQELDLNQLMLVRKEKLDKLKQEGKDPYTITKFNRTHTSKQIIDNYTGTVENVEPQEQSRAISEKTAKQVLSMMESVVSEGTGRNARSIRI